MVRWLLPLGLWVQIGLCGLCQGLTMQELVNPILTSEEDIDSHATQCRKFLASNLETLPAGRSAAEQSLQQSLARLYLTFARPGRTPGGVEPGNLELIDLQTHGDQALRLLRERIGLLAPPGYVFVRTFSSRHSMPNEILLAFQRQETQAVTFLGRYIAILAPPPAMASEEVLYQRLRAQVLSHELVHAFIGSTVAWYIDAGADQEQVALRNGLPTWFHEGCATYLSDSPGGGCVTDLVETPVGYRHLTIRSRAPTDYQAYRMVFDYAESRLGRQRLFAALRRVIQEQDAHLMLSSIQATSFEQASAQAHAWNDRRWTLTYGLAILAVLAGLSYFWRLLPRTRTVGEEL